MAVVIDHHHGFKPFNRCQRCRLQSFTQFDYNILELGQTNLTHSLKQAFEVANIHRSFSSPCFPLATRFEEEFDGNPRIEIVGGHGAPRVRALVVEVAIAMASGINPLPLSSGLGGAHLLRSKTGDNIAVAKPIDEEALALNNPKGFGGLMLGQPGVKRSVRVGGTGIREVAAYLLDHGGFAGVPPTALVKIASPVQFNVNNGTTKYKIASLQRFVHHDFDAGELGPSGFSVASVHRIGIFDVRLLNLDRHAGNILVKKNDERDNYSIGAAELVPIDHGLCLPEWLDDPYFEWLHWPQASVPFSEIELDYISNLDPFKDAQLLRTELPSLEESSIRILILCTIFLKQAASKGLCLADIGEMMTREFCSEEKNLSELENLCAKAKAYAVKASDDEDDGKKKNEQISMKEKEGVDIFEFNCGNGNASEKVLDIPQLLQCPPSMAKVPRFSSVRSMPRLHDSSTLSPMYSENNHDDNCSDNTKIKEDNGRLTRSTSCSAQNCKWENQGISLGDMSGEEWELFLECFQKLLPKVFQGTKCMASKQRLGTSGKF
ncbi:hypothetical protein JCGZ_16949 [Jatropha curcas]|uniref:1-phosphatidylinositol 4-kinase n=1 Tax=Jatropha curcas TaxID=180498 RepID=A0A067KE94_JATCU|nr:phosphatidylinositol 4-kinase gamma 8 [Jatropha curcas]KDP30575.1 hypothetical protein JCGZ_16949 [Jatropha curcas]